MRRQLLDESVRFSCGSCGRCCEQPWRIRIEPEKARALDRHDFSAYPQLVGKKFYHERSSGPNARHELAKGEGARCLFLDTDGLCIIHKELGSDAKPQMCREFPLLEAHTWLEDRVSANYGCPAVQQQSGTPLTEQAGDIAAIVPISKRSPKPDGLVPLDLTCKLTLAENDALFDRVLSVFDDRAEGDLWRRFGKVLALLAAVREFKGSTGRECESAGSLADLLRSGHALPNTPEVPGIWAYREPSAAPMPVRFLFAATLYPDTIPAEGTSRMSLLKRLTLIPKLLTLAQFSGAYPSLLLGRNVSIRQVMGHEVAGELDPAAAQVLLRYYRSRFWQRMIAGTRLPIIAGIHQHIHDFNAVIFMARAEAQAVDESRLTEPLIRQALTRVEFLLANQPRLFEQKLKGWLRGQLADPGLAFQSLRLMATKKYPPGPTTEWAWPADGRADKHPLAATDSIRGVRDKRTRSSPRSNLIQRL